MPLKSLNKSWDQEDPNRDIPSQVGINEDMMIKSTRKSDEKPTSEMVV